MRAMLCVGHAYRYSRSAISRGCKTTAAHALRRRFLAGTDLLQSHALRQRRRLQSFGNGNLCIDQAAYVCEYWRYIGCGVFWLSHMALHLSRWSAMS